VLGGAEIALAIVVLTIAGISIRGFIENQQADPGYRTDNVLLLSFNPSLVNYSQEETTRFYEEIVQRTKILPGVSAVGLGQFIPLGVSNASSTVVIDGYEMPEGQDRISVPGNIVDPGYWSAMHTRIVRGRAFTESDTGSSLGVAIVNETFAKKYWPNGTPPPSQEQSAHTSNRLGRTCRHSTFAPSRPSISHER
jgi:macrolide transport system ATP-binding/permease protein